MLNNISIMGRLVADPQMRQTTTCKAVCSFRIACDRGRKDANGQNQVDWIDCVAWEKTAEFICRYFAKGALIALTGRLQTRQYQDKNGNNRTAVEVVASAAYFCGSKEQGAAPAPVRNVPQKNDDYTPIDETEDLPF